MLESKLFHLKIAIPSRICFNDNVKSVEICSSEGYLGILPKHIPVIGNTVPSYIFIEQEGNKKKIGVINNGLFSFDDNKLNVVSDFFEFTDDLSIDAIDKRNEVIMKALKEAKIDEARRHKIETQVSVTTAKLKELAKK